MRITKVFRRLIIGSDHFIKSRGEFKRVMLTGYLAMLCIVSNLAYVLIGVQDGHSFNIWLNYIFCFSALICLLLLRLKKYTAAKLILFTAAFFIIFIFCTLEPFHTGVYIYLVLISIGAFALFGYEQMSYSLALTIGSAILFSVAYIGNFKIWEVTYSDEYIRDNFLLNFFTVLITSVLILYFLLDVNRYTEESLIKKEAETQEKNKTLVKLNAELDRFVYSVSHDLRSPLASISGLVNIGKHAQTVDEAKEYFHMIDERLKTQDFFIKEIIEFYRNSRTTINAEEFSLRNEVDSVVQGHSFGETHDAVQYKIHIPDDLLVRTDKIRLRSVLSNLVGNALKYHDYAKPERFIAVGSERQNGHIKIFVEDNGLGIGQEHLPKVFDMFYRASADSKGSGLGLFIAKETVNKLGGDIQVSSKLGEGSNFAFTIPA